MVLDNSQSATAVESFQPSKVENTTSSFSSLDLLKASNSTGANSEDASRSSKAEPQTLEMTNPFSPSVLKADCASANKSENFLAADNKPTEKPLRNSELPDQKKFTPEEQEKAATELAKEITEKGFAKAPELRDKVRAQMLKAYMDGDMDGPGNQKAMEKFVQQISDKLPKGMSLKIDSSPDNKDLAAFREKAQAAIDKQPGMKMGASGQLQLCKTENGKTTVEDKLHFAASIRKVPKTVKV